MSVSKTDKSIGTIPVNVRDLSFMALFSLIFGSMMGSGIFDVPQNVASGAGLTAVMIGWVITAVGVFSLSWAFAYITMKRPDIQSGIYGYARYGFGNYVGFNSAWGYALNSLIANASYLIYICATLGGFAIFGFFGKGTTYSAIIFESMLIWCVFFIIKRGINEAAIVNTIITFAKIIMLVVLIGLFAIAFSWTKFKANLAFEPKLGDVFTQIKSTMLVTVWNFTGIEAACIFALRAKKQNDIIKATLLGAFAVCLLCSLMSILPFGIMSGDEIRNLATPSSAGILTHLYGLFSGNFLRVAILVSVLGALLAWTMLTGNMFYLAAIDETMPKIFTKLNNREVPINALFISSVGAEFFIILAHFTNEVYLGMIQLATSLILLPYLLSTMFALKLVFLEKKIDVLSLLKGLLAVLYGVWLVYSGGMKFLALSSVLYLIGAVFYFVARKEHKKKLFDNKGEVILFLVFLVITVIAVIKWPHALLNPSLMN
jgi:arginine:ornithine antiporter / lysine permease